MIFSSPAPAVPMTTDMDTIAQVVAFIAYYRSRLNGRYGIPAYEVGKLLDDIEHALREEAGA